jgi:hypothetical protein
MAKARDEGTDHDVEHLPEHLQDLHPVAEAIDAEVRRGVKEVKEALATLRTRRPPDNALSEGVRYLGLEVDSLRQSVWAVLKAQNAGDLAGYIGRVRISRANGLCQDVLADLYTDTVPSNMPGLRVFSATLQELAEVLEVRDDE